ncbi:MAG: LamG-like jellyroll fold domain-containing protein, partial [Planctomycetota bacterium]
NSSAAEIAPKISGDGRTLFFSDYDSGPFRPGGYGAADIWVTTRATVSDPWSIPVNLGPTVNSSALDGHPAISADGSTIFFMSVRPGGLGGHDLWQAPVLPVVDFNGDGIVDSADMCIMVDYWGTDEPLCDIGPMPWGDGIVDIQDLIVLAECLFEDVNDPTLIAHWALDETTGFIAYDNAGAHDGTLNGNPLWQPTGGKVDGALAFDGTDDYLSTDFVLSPADGPFSVFAWIKEGAPGQVILSQVGEANWLSADPSEGKLMSGLEGIGRSGCALTSQTLITDGGWHRIGLTWDGSNRILYVDDVEVAKDTQNQPAGSSGGLYTGSDALIATLVK